MVICQGSSPSSNIARLNAVRMPKSPHPGHHAGFCPLYSAKVTIDLLQQALEGERPSVVLPYASLELVTRLHPEQLGEPPGRVVLDTYRRLRVPDRVHEAPAPFFGQRVQLGEVHPVSYTHLRAHETRHDLVCRL